MNGKVTVRPRAVIRVLDCPDVGRRLHSVSGRSSRNSECCNFGKQTCASAGPERCRSLFFRFEMLVEADMRESRLRDQISERRVVDTAFAEAAGCGFDNASTGFGAFLSGLSSFIFFAPDRFVMRSIAHRWHACSALS